MTKNLKHCGWCGGVIPESTGVGRPRRYCRRSHRQRAFEARRLGEARGLGPGEAVVKAADLAHLTDNLYLLRSALEDVAEDLREDPDPDDLLAALHGLGEAAREVLRAKVEPAALGSEAGSSTDTSP